MYEIRTKTMSNKIKQFREEMDKEFEELFPISIDYPPIENTIENMEVFTQIEINRRVKRARAKNEQIKSHIHSRENRLLEILEGEVENYIESATENSILSISEKYVLTKALSDIITLIKESRV